MSPGNRGFTTTHTLKGPRQATQHSHLLIAMNEATAEKKSQPQPDVTYFTRSVLIFTNLSSRILEKKIWRNPLAVHPFEFSLNAIKFLGTVKKLSGFFPFFCQLRFIAGYI